MKTTTKKISATRVELKVVLEKNDLKKARDLAIEQLAKTAKIPGFRKGKAPAELALKQLNPNDLANTTLDIAVRNSVPAAFTDAQQTPLAMPEVNVTKFVPDEVLEYTATADVLPEVKLGDFKALKVKKTTTNVSEKDITEVLEGVRKGYAEKKAAKKAAELGDEVIIDFVGKKDGKAFAGGSAKDFALLLGSNQFIPGFETGLVGHRSGDKFDLPLSFPKNYQNPDLAGAEVNFEILLKQVNTVTLPKLDNAFAAKCGPFKTIAELKADIKKNLKAQNQHKANEKYKDDLVAALVEQSTVAAPAILIQDQLRFIKDDVTRNAAAQGSNFEQYLKQTGQSAADWEKSVTPIAEARVKASLCLQVLARDQKISVDEALVDAKLAELRDVYQKSPEALKNLQDPRARQDIKNRLTIDATLDFLVQANQ